MNRKSLELRYSRPLLIAGLIGCLVAAGAVAYVGIAFGVILPQMGLLAAVFLTPIGLILLWWAVAAMRALANTGPILIIDHDGIWDIRQSQQFIPWDDIQRAQLRSTRRGPAIHVDFKPEVARDYVGRLYGLRRLFNVLSAAGDRELFLGALSYRYKDVERALRDRHREHRVQAVRQHADNEKVMRELRERNAR